MGNIEAIKEKIYEIVEEIKQENIMKYDIELKYKN